MVGKEKKMKGGMVILHHPFLSELSEGGMLKIGIGALAGQRARSSNSRSTSELLSAGDRARSPQPSPKSSESPVA